MNEKMDKIFGEQDAVIKKAFRQSRYWDITAIICIVGGFIGIITHNFFLTNILTLVFWIAFVIYVFGPFKKMTKSLGYMKGYLDDMDTMMDDIKDKIKSHEQTKL